MTRASVHSGSAAARPPGPRPAPRSGQPGPPGPAPARIAGGSTEARSPAQLFHGRLAPRPSSVVDATRPKRRARGSRPRERRDRARSRGGAGAVTRKPPAAIRTRGSQSRGAPRREPGGSPVERDHSEEGGQQGQGRHRSPTRGQRLRELSEHAESQGDHPALPGRRAPPPPPALRAEPRGFGAARHLATRR